MTPEAAVDPGLFEQLVPLASLRPERRQDLARNAVLRRVPAGTVLFGSGEAATEALFVLDGQVALEDATGRVLATVTGGEAAARHRLAHQSPRAATARCRTPVRLLAVDAGLLDVMLSWDQTGAFEVKELDGSAAGDGGDWMARLLQLGIFQRVPPANLQAMFMRMGEVRAAPGQTIVKQDAEGDYFYVLVDGRCLVTREPPSGKPIRLAELQSGAVFGEEALIADARRNATVTALTPCRLMRLSKNDFRSLLNDPLSRRLEPGAARRMVDSGQAVWLDVRLPSEFQAGHLPGAVSLPLYMLRPRLTSLKRETAYITVCDTGRRGSVAAFILTEKGYEAYVLDGGMAALDV